MNREIFRQNILELIRRTSAFLPPDVENVINLQRKLEAFGSKAKFALELVAQNIGLAKARSLPICQDTGTINFYFETPRGVDQLQLEELCCDAVREATLRGYLRQNSVDSVDGKNTGDNLGPGSPVFHWEQTHDPNIHVRLILKGGGCENMSAQYSLPAEIQGKRVDRNIEGVRACILDAIWKAQGKGCGPGFIGVSIGGDRASGYDFAKRQLLRNVDDTNSDPVLAQLEARIMKESDVRKLKVGDVVLLNGIVFTGRDAVHKYLHDGGELEEIRNGVIYHCGPVMLKEGGEYRVVAAGPTTSIREEPYQADIIKQFGVKAVIGKGGMEPKTQKACQENGCVYLHAIGGAAQIYAQCVERVLSVRLEQFGSPEAVWELQVENFPAVVTIDSHGNNLQQAVTDRSRELFAAAL